jgi:hypothetical protein
LNARRWLFVLGALALFALWQHAHRPIKYSPGVLVPAVPSQESLRFTPDLPRKGDMTIKPLAKFSLSARVLSRADYSWDAGAALVPVDLALGWGRMSDSAVLDKIEISQSGRFYFWRVSEFPIPENEIIESSANMHLIPADASTQRAIERTRIGDVVTFDGYLVEANGPNGYKWTSSLTRSDSGAGACELVWVEHFDIAARH